MAITQMKVNEVLYDIQDSRTEEQLKTDLNIPTATDYTVTLGTAWTGDAAPFYQDVTLAEIVALDKPIVDVITNSTNYEVMEKEWAKVFRVECLAGRLRFYAKQKTESALQISVKVVN